MSQPQTATPQQKPNAAKPAEKEEELKAPEDQFWETYSPHYEFPISMVASIALHVLFVGLLVMYLLGHFDSKAKRQPMEIGVAAGNEDGDNQEEGAAGGGSALKDEIKQDKLNTAKQDIQKLDLPQVVKQVASVLPELNEEDLQEQVKVSDNMQAMTKALDEQLRNALVKNLRDKPGNGPGKGKTGTGPGAGPAGDPNGRPAQLVRWTIRFDTYGTDLKSMGDDYLRQLAGLGAWIALPIPGNKTQVRLIKDLNKRGQGEVVNNDDIEARMFFTDNQAESREKVALALNLPEIPPFFLAMFPLEREDEMRMLEKQRLGGKKLDQVKQTYFRIDFVGGKYKFRVEDMTFKDKRG
jgi:hypothetical protein